MGNHLDQRQRTIYLVLAVVLGHLILISSQVESSPRTTVLERVTFGAFSEIQQLVFSASEAVKNSWSDYVNLRAVRSENKALQSMINELEFKLQKQDSSEQEVNRLEKLLELKSQTVFTTVSARVVASDATSYFRTLTIDRGTNDSVISESAVLAPTGVVGRIVGVPSSSAARVQLLVDRNAAAGARIERTRALGVVVGGDDEKTLTMSYVSKLEDVAVGDSVVTSGTDGIYPSGFDIGRVTQVESDSGLYLVIKVEPVVEFTKLENVLVLINDSPATKQDEASK